MKLNKQYTLNSEEPNVDFLHQTGKKTGMTVPEGFFAAFEARMEAAIDQEVAKKTTLQPEHEEAASQKKSAFGKNWWMSIAACFIVALCAWPIWNSLNEEAADASQAATTIAEAETENQEDQIFYASMSDYDIYDLYCEAY